MILFHLFPSAANEKFLKLVGIESPQSFTVFDIVEPTMMPKLYEIFLVALQPTETEEEGQESDIEKDLTYSSLTVPCAKLGNSDPSYYITVSWTLDLPFIFSYATLGGLFLNSLSIILAFFDV